MMSPSIPPVVGAEYLERANLDERPVLADVRWYLDGRSGRAAYDAGHIPGAVFVDLDRWLAAPASPDAGRHPLPDPAVFAEGMASLGIGDDTVVIAYDDYGGIIAARLVWMLRVIGHEAALLDGGLQSYSGPTSTTSPSVVPAHFTPTAWPAARLAGIEDALTATHVVIDARPPERYRGDEEPVDPRPGHIPGAVSVPCRDNVDAGGRFLPVAELRARFEAAGIGAPSSGVISYCGSGVSACQNLLAMELAGLGVGRLYPGSWSQYSADPSRPAALGDD